MRFEDSDRTGDDMDFVAVKPGTAKIRCYVYGKNKERYGDTIKVSVTEAKKDYSLRKSGASVKYEEVWDDFDLEVKKGDSIKENQLKWKISNPDIVDFANWKKPVMKWISMLKSAEQQRSPAAILIPRVKKNRLCIR